MEALTIPELSQLRVDAAPTITITPDYFVMHFEEFLPKFIANGSPSLDTLRSYRIQIHAFIRWAVAQKRHPLACSDYNIREYRAALIEKQYRQESIQLKLSAVRAFFHAACELHLVDQNPATDIHVSTSAPPDSLMHFFTPVQLGTIIRAWDTEKDIFIRNRNRLILYLMGVEGLRNVEVHRLCLEDINWDIKALLIRGKGARNRMDPIYPCEETFKILKEYLDSIPKDTKHPIQKDGALTPLILSNSARNYLGRISRNGIRLIMNKALTKCHLKQSGYSCHIFRHSCGTNLYQQTKDLRLVQETLRQRDPKITARYAHVNQRISDRKTASITPDFSAK